MIKIISTGPLVLVRTWLGRLHITIHIQPVGSPHFTPTCRHRRCIILSHTYRLALVTKYTQTKNRFPQHAWHILLVSHNIFLSYTNEVFHFFYATILQTSNSYSHYLCQYFIFLFKCQGVGGPEPFHRAGCTAYCLGAPVLRGVSSKLFSALEHACTHTHTHAHARTHIIYGVS